MDEIYATVMALLPIRRKITPSGWISFDAVCCHHRGESRDDRSRGGMLPNQKGGFQYHCFNCGYKAGWTPGHLLSINTRQLLRWIGVSDSDIMRMALTALKLRQDQDPIKKTLNFELVEKSLPEECKLITEWAQENCTDVDFLAVIDYLVQRGMELDWYDWMWSSSKGYRDRVILPFYYDRKIVGHTGRKIRDGKPKYLTESQPGYVFNLDHQTYDRKYVIVVEGQFDAIAIDGVAIMHNEPNETQCARINALGKEVIVVPDRDHAGSKMIKSAMDHNWQAAVVRGDVDVV